MSGCCAMMEVEGRRETPQRRCIVSGAVRPKQTLVRFVVAPDGRIVPDIEGRLPGRGLWLSADKEMLNKACAKNLFAKAARASVVVPGDLAQHVEQLLVCRCVSLVGLARRAGQAVVGYEKVREWLRAGRVGVLLTACDASFAGREKLHRLAGNVPVVETMTSAELGIAAGRDRAVHGAIARGRLAQQLSLEAARLAGCRGTPPVPVGDEASKPEYSL